MFVSCLQSSDGKKAKNAGAGDAAGAENEVSACDEVILMCKHCKMFSRGCTQCRACSEVYCKKCLEKETEKAIMNGDVVMPIETCSQCHFDCCRRCWTTCNCGISHVCSDCTLAAGFTRCAECESDLSF